MLWCIGCLATLPASQAEELPPLLRNVILVEGEVTAAAAAPVDGVLRATITVQRVFCAPPGFDARTFFDYAVAGSGDLGGRAARPPFQIGEAGIWCLRPHDGQLLTIRAQPFGFWFGRARQAHDPRYNEIVRVAEATKRFCDAAAGDRAPMLATLAGDRTSEVALWAVRVLTTWRTPEADKVFDALVRDGLARDGSLPLAAQVGLDEALADWRPGAPRRRADWANSDERKRLLQSWVAADLDAFNAQLALIRVNAARQKGDLVEGLYLDLMRSLLDNRRLPWSKAEFTTVVAGVVKMTARYVGDAEAAFAFLVDVLSDRKDSGGIEKDSKVADPGEPKGKADDKGKDHGRDGPPGRARREVRLGAAQGFWRFPSLTPAQLARLVALREKEKDKDVAAALDEAIAKFKSP